MLRICFENSELRVFEAHLVTRDEGVIVERSGDVTRFTLEVDWSLSRFKGADEVTLEKLTKGSVTYPAFPRFHVSLRSATLLCPNRNAPSS